MKLLKAFKNALGVVLIPAAIVGSLLLTDYLFGVVAVVIVGLIMLIGLATFVFYEDWE